MMAQLLEDSSFCEEFIQQCPAAVEVLNLVAQECSPGRYPACSWSFIVILRDITALKSLHFVLSFSYLRV